MVVKKKKEKKEAAKEKEFIDCEEWVVGFCIERYDQKPRARNEPPAKTMRPGIWEHHDTRNLRTPWHQDFAHVTSLSEAIELFLGAFKLVLVNEWSNLALILYFVNTPTQ